MKKVKYVALALVLVLGLIGGAYAIWEEELTVGATVKTGTFDVEFYQCFGQLTSGSPEHDLNNYVMEMSGGLTDEKTAWFEFTNLYPVSHYGHGPLLRLRGENIGTTPAYLESVVVDWDNWSNTELQNYMKVRVQMAVDDGSGWSVVGSSGERPLTELAEAIEAAAAGVVLEEGYKFGFGSDDESHNSIRIYLDEAAGMDLQDEEVSFTIRMNFRQWNL